MPVPIVEASLDGHPNLSIDQKGPLVDTDKTYNRSKYNVMIEWENGETTSGPLTTIAADDPITCAIYASENDLLELDGWKRFKGQAKQQKKLL